MGRRVFSPAVPKQAAADYASEPASLNKKNRRPQLIMMGVAAGCFILAGVFGVLALNSWHEETEVVKLWDDIKGIAVVSDDSDEGDNAYTGEALDSDIVAEEDPMDRVIDWDALLAINSEVIAWVYIPDTQVDYPVLQEQTFDESYYLNHNIYGKSQSSGCIFTPKLLDGWEDMHMLIYGHHMKNGSMFGTLTKYKDKSYYEEHPYVYIYYPDRTEQWQVWTAEHVKDTDLVYCMPYISGSPEYEELIAGLQSGSLYETSVGSIDSETGFITLTTCDNTDGSGTGRFIVNIVCTKSISSDGRDLLDTVNHSIFQ